MSAADVLLLSLLLEGPNEFYPAVRTFIRSVLDAR